MLDRLAGETIDDPPQGARRRRGRGADSFPLATWTTAGHNWPSTTSSLFAWRGYLAALA